MNDAAVRTLAGVGGSGTTWSMNSLYGKSNQFAFTISANQTNANLRTLAVNAGWNQSSKVVATIGSGVYISSNTTGTPGLTIDGSFPGGVDLINSGFIIGMGGAGGNGAGVSSNTSTQYPGTAGAGGGLALSVSSAVSITNNGTIGGGGGGGGGGQGAVVRFPDGGGNAFVELRGGGGGGGQSGAAANSAGGAPGTPDNPLWISAQAQTGGAGTSSGAGSGGAGSQSNPTPGASGGDGGAGGTLGVGGTTGANGTNGGYFFVVGTQTGPYSGGSAGGAVSGNSNITWVATGTRLGAIT
jgi:hypothetical protein